MTPDGTVFLNVLFAACGLGPGGFQPGAADSALSHQGRAQSLPQNRASKLERGKSRAPI